MIDMQRTVHTTASPEAVFDYLADFTNAQEWDPNAVKVLRLTGDGSIGSTYRVTSKFAGATTDLDYELTERAPHTLIRLKGEKKSITAIDTITIEPSAALGEPDATGTDVTYAVQFEFHGALGLLEPVMKLAVRKLLDDGAKGLTAKLAELR